MCKNNAQTNDAFVQKKSFLLVGVLSASLFGGLGALGVQGNKSLENGASKSLSEIPLSKSSPTPMPSLRPSLKPSPSSRPFPEVRDPYFASCETFVPKDYLGISTEWSMIPYWFGTDKKSTIPATTTLLKSLAGKDSTPLLRVGGNSGEGYLWDTKGDTRTNRLFSGSITPGMIDAVLKTVTDANWKVTLSVNLRSNRPDLAAEMTKYALEHDTSGVIEAIELGNEPNSYVKTPQEYLEKVQAYQEALTKIGVRDVAFTGPSISQGVNPAYLSLLKKEVSPKSLTWHHYGNRPTLKALLEKEVNEDFLIRIKEIRDQVNPQEDSLQESSLQEASTPLRINEGASVGNGGLPGVSDTFGSSTWTVEEIFTAAQEGMAGYNLHAWDGLYYPADARTSFYTPFMVRDKKIVPKPGLYALKIAKELSNKKMCSVSPLESSVKDGKKDEELNSWTLLSQDEKTASFVFINKDTKKTKDLNFRAPLGYTKAHSKRITGLNCDGAVAYLNGEAVKEDGTLAEKLNDLSLKETYAFRLKPCETLSVIFQKESSQK